jgi:hypothetical protein
VQAVYVSGTISTPFNFYMTDPRANANMDWRGHENYPRPDYLSSSRKRLAPQLIYKGGILHAWQRKMAVAVDSLFFAQLPTLAEVEPEHADLAWLVYDLIDDTSRNLTRLTLARIVYTSFGPALERITQSEAGNEQDFLDTLQARLDKVLASGDAEGTAPDATTPQTVTDLDE